MPREESAAHRLGREVLLAPARLAAALRQQRISVLFLTTALFNQVARLAPDTFVGEVVMKDEMTAFLKQAAARGCRFQVGTDMLFEQIPAYLEFFGLPTTTPETLRQLAKISY